MTRGHKADGKNANWRHGYGNRLPEYNAWQNAKRRCYDPNLRTYGYYGARGIRVCERWIGSFANFYEDMGPRPTPKHSLDRIDPDKGYGPENCRWATKTEQNNPRHKSRQHGTAGQSSGILSFGG